MIHNKKSLMDLLSDGKLVTKYIKYSLGHMWVTEDTMVIYQIRFRSFFRRDALRFISTMRYDTMFIAYSGLNTDYMKNNRFFQLSVVVIR